MSSSMKVCEPRVVCSTLGPGQGGGLGLQVQIVGGAGGGRGGGVGGGGGELVVPHILHSPDPRDRWPSLFRLQVCQGSFASLGQPRELQ